MTNQTPGAVATDGGGPVVWEPTNAEKLAALDMYIKTLTAMASSLRHTVTIDMGTQHVEKVGAYLPDGTKIASVSRLEGNKSVKVSNEADLLAWCLKNYPDEVQTVTAQTVRPAFLKKLLDDSKSQPVGPGLDTRTGQELPFIQVTRGDPFVRVDTTDEGVTAMGRLAYDFLDMIEARH